ncbi:DUF1203 domain-containing protein [Actinopolymorpha alba]|uniref:DUF1203 domain-containing protein n=1 Tax=Actinopolymorpha alba TaxID=533267 RepID=UPI0012F6F89A|nr:DUF1203 domain-containing protein [Actinopolymorpha alba]
MTTSTSTTTSTSLTTGSSMTTGTSMTASSSMTGAPGTTRPDLRIVPVPAATLRRLREQGYDDFGIPWTVVPGAPGRPVRCCLRRTTPDERVVLISYAPVHHAAFTDRTAPYNEVGPIFVHAEECEGYVEDGGFPSAWREAPQVLRAYAPDGEILDGVLTQPDEDRLAIAADLLREPGVAFVHSRCVGPGCFAFEIRRA